MTYRSHFNSWAKFCKLADIDPAAPPTEQTLCYWLAWAFSRKKRPLAYKSAKSYLAGIRAMHEINFGTTFAPYNRMRTLERALLGYKKKRSGPTKTRLPLTVALLRQLAPFVNRSDPDELTTWCALVVGVFGLFRTGELTAKTSKSQFFPRFKHLKRLSSGHFSIWLEASKTDIFRQGVAVHLMSSGNDAACPVRELVALLGRREGARPDEPLFSVGGAALTRAALIKFMKTLLGRAGVQCPQDYNGHSMRKGGAQSLADAQVSAYDIQTLGRWKSDCFRVYIRLSHHRLADFAQRMARAKASALLY